MPQKRLSADELQQAFVDALPASGEIPFTTLADTLDRDVLQQWHNLKHTGRIITRTEHDGTSEKAVMYVKRA
jgi:hypothetical protein